MRLKYSSPDPGFIYSKFKGEKQKLHAMMFKKSEGNTNRCMIRIGTRIQISGLLVPARLGYPVNVIDPMLVLHQR